MASQDETTEKKVDSGCGALHGLADALLTRRFGVGDRVVATVTIVDGWTTSEVPEGTGGKIVAIDVYGCVPLVRVLWDWPTGLRFVTMVTNLERVSS